MKKECIKIAVILMVTAFVSSSFVIDVSAQTPVRKLGRGLANAFTGFLELPQNIVDVAEDEGALAAVTYGIARGIAMTFLRTAVGVYETVTFMVPLPFDYEPILEPEFMMGEDN